MKYYGNFSIIILLTGNFEQLRHGTFCLDSVLQMNFYETQFSVCEFYGLHKNC